MVSRRAKSSLSLQCINKLNAAAERESRKEMEEGGQPMGRRPATGLVGHLIVRVRRKMLMRNGYTSRDERLRVNVQLETSRLCPMERRRERRCEGMKGSTRQAQERIEKPKMTAARIIIIITAPDTTRLQDLS